MTVDSYLTIADKTAVSPPGRRMLSLKKDEKEEEDKDGGNPYSKLEKTSVLQEARWVHAGRCPVAK